MLNPLLLQNLRVLITRPKPQAQALAKQLTDQGAHCFLYPSLQIEPLILSSNLLSQLKEQKFLILTSVNAVLAIGSHLQQLDHENALPKLIAVGPATQQCVLSFRLPTPDCPVETFSSEGVLVLESLMQCKNQRIGLLSGIGGRKLLHDQLQHRGAIVKKFEVYRRLPAQKPTMAELSTWQNPGIDVVISTSAEGLKQLVASFDAIGEQAKTWLLAQCILVMSERLVPVTKDLQFLHPPLIASSQCDAGIVHTLTNFWIEKRNNHV